MKKLIFIALISILAAGYGCKKEYALPTVSSPSAKTIEVSTEADVTFNYTAEAGFSTSSLSATGGTASIKTNGTSGSTTGSIVVTFTAGITVGAGSVMLTVKDAEGQSESGVAVFSIFEEGAPVLTAPSNSEVELLKSIDITFPFTSEGGYKSSSASATGGTVVVKTEPSANATSGNVVVTFTAARTVGAGSVVLTITDSNNKAGQATDVIDIKNRPTVSVSSNISTNTTWETGKIYILEGRISVLDGATLTIEPGVIVKGNAGTGSNATALLIARGGKIEAVGTEASPIIFTSISDHILPGEIQSPNLVPTNNGLWGGLLVLGRAHISPGSGTEFTQIEGIPISDQNGLYGGTDDTDNSGTIKYVSIRHGGANIGEGNEINGLTLGGVGSGTVIENVEIIGNQDDGIEIFGGNVNLKNALVWNSYDDGIDTDQAWGGMLDNFIVIGTPDSETANYTDNGLEIDGPESVIYSAAHTVKNGSIKGNTSKMKLGTFKADAKGTFENIYFFNFGDPAASGGKGTLAVTDEASQANYANGILNFVNLECTPAAGIALTSIFLNGTDVHATSVTAATKTVGADATKFANWTWASLSGQLTGF